MNTCIKPMLPYATLCAHRRGPCGLSVLSPAVSGDYKVTQRSCIGFNSCVNRLRFWKASGVGQNCSLIRFLPTRYIMESAADRTVFTADHQTWFGDHGHGCM